MNKYHCLFKTCDCDYDCHHKIETNHIEPKKKKIMNINDSFTFLFRHKHPIWFFRFLLVILYQHK